MKLLGYTTPWRILKSNNKYYWDYIPWKLPRNETHRKFYLETHNKITLKGGDDTGLTKEPIGTSCVAIYKKDRGYVARFDSNSLDQIISFETFVPGTNLEIVVEIGA